MFNFTEQEEWLYSRAERPAEKPVENLPGVCYNKSVKTKLKGLRQRCGLRKDETLTKKPKFTLQLQYNSPVILTFFLLSLGVLFLGQWTGGWTTTHLFCVYRSSLKDPLFYVRLFGHVLGHGSWDHFLNNMLLLLVIGPPMEEKYGSIPLLRGILLTALISGILQCALFPHSALLGASGIVFMLIMLASLSGFSGGIPVTMLLVAVLYLGQQVYDVIFVRDNVANFMHIVGGVCGTVFGYTYAAFPRRKKAQAKRASAPAIGQGCVPGFPNRRNLLYWQSEQNRQNSGEEAV